MPRLAVRPLEDRTVPVAGLLDPTFSGDGILKLDLPGFSTTMANGVAVQPDGKTLLAGHGDATPRPALLVRLTADGTPDPTFGGGDGVVSVAFPGEASTFYAAAVRPDGKIVASGTVGFGSDYRVLVARFLPSGAPDPAFGGGDGVVTTNLTSRDENGFALALQPDGKIVVAGNILSDSDDGFLVLRYTAAGELDTSFSLDGVAKFNPGGSGAVGRGVAVQPDGKVVVAGSGSQIGSPREDFLLVRLTADGEFDPTFSGDGVASATFPATSVGGAYDVALAPDGKIVAAGGVLLSADPVFGQHALARFLPDGTLDATFSGDGMLVPDVPEVVGGLLQGVTVEADGQIVAVGEGVRPGGDGLSTLFRFNADGTADADFGVGNFRLAPGIVATNSGGGEEFNDVALAPDGRIVAAGISDGRMLAVRYTGDPIDPANAPPVAEDDAYIVSSSPFNVSAALGVLENDTDADGDPLTAVLVTPPAVGSLSLAADGSFTFTFPGSFTGSTTFTYKVNDGTEDGSTATVTLTVGANQAPTANPDAYALPFATELVVPAATGVLANDTDPEGDALAATLVSPPAVGTLTLNPNGGFVYSYPAELVGGVTFTYRVDDAGVPGNTATVTLTREHLVNTRAGVLTVIGSDAADSVRLRPAGANVVVEVQSTGGLRTTAVPTTAVTQAVFYLGSGDDRLDTTLVPRPVRANGGPGADTLRTGLGADVLYGDAGDDLIAAGEGRNEVHPGDGNNVVTTGAGADTIAAGNGANVIRAGGGRNNVTLGDGSNVVATGAGNDTVRAGGGNNAIDTGAGNDTVEAGDGRNDIRTGGGADRVTVGNGGNVVDAGAGSDVVVAGGGADWLTGGLGNDLLAGGLGADVLAGDAGNDVLFDGTATPTRPADTLAKLLARYDPSRRSSLVRLTNRLTVTADAGAADTLTGGVGIDWFWTAGADVLDQTGTEPRNGVS